MKRASEKSDSERPCGETDLRRFVTRLLVLACLLLTQHCHIKPPSGRPFHIINLSLPRTATTSFSGIFDRFPSTHEFLISATINALLDFREKKISRGQLREFLLRRDRQAGHYVDSATFFFLEPELLIDTFPEARFFLSVRDCESWVASMADISVLSHRLQARGAKTVDLRFLRRFSRVFFTKYSPAIFLEAAKLRSEAGRIVHDLASAWEIHVARGLRALHTVEPERKLIIETVRFNDSVPRIAHLAGLSVSDLNLEKMHMNKDRDLSGHRSILGPQRIYSECNPRQKRIDALLSGAAF